MEKTVIELFAGVGGFRVGLNDVHEIDNKTGIAIENRNWDFCWFNQWEPSTKAQDAYECYRKRFNEERSVDEKNLHYWNNKDISTVPLNIIPQHSLLVGGFPCQDYSVARSKSGEKGIEGKKGVLFWEIKRIIENKNTPFVLLENVDRLLKSPAFQRGRDFGIMLRTFFELDYNVEWRVINAADYGCAQKRRRIFIFAWKNNLNYNNQIINASITENLLRNGFFAHSFPLNQENLNKIKQSDLTVYEDSVQMTNDYSFLFENTGIMIDGIAYTIKTEPIKENAITLGEIRENGAVSEDLFLNPTQIEKFEELKGSKKKPRKKPNGETYFYSEGSMCFPDDLNLPGRTMLTSESSINRSSHVIDDFQTHRLRFITPVEAERLQSFPDNWTDSGMTTKRRYFMMGNALVTKIINRLEPYLANIIENE